MKRRDAIKTLGALAGVASMSKLLSACGGGDGSEPGISTIVFMMMENRSFDHYLGSRALLEGKAENGLVAGMTYKDQVGSDFEIWEATDDAMCVADPPHSWNASRAQFNGGANDGFLTEYQARYGGVARESIQYMVRKHLPVTYALADEYTVCDSWFASVMGPTLPNRMYWHAATSGGAKSNDEVLQGAFEGVDTLYHRLDAAGVDWAYYYSDLPVLSVIKGVPLEGRVRRLWYDLFDDAAAGRLPPVVYIDPNFTANDDHPPRHPLFGQQLISAVYQALATSPQWDNCLFVLTYDEHGGFFDHVPPPITADERASEGFDQLGFRVPTLVMGPYAKKSYVSSVQYDHTSALKHLENVHQLAPLTARSSAASDLVDCIDLERLDKGMPAAPISVPAVEIDESKLAARCGVNVARRTLSDQIADWADANRVNLGEYDRRHEQRDYLYGIADYLDHHGLGRIRRK